MKSALKQVQNDPLYRLPGIESSALGLLSELTAGERKITPKELKSYDTVWNEIGQFGQVKLIMVKL